MFNATINSFMFNNMYNKGNKKDLVSVIEDCWMEKFLLHFEGRSVDRVILKLEGMQAREYLMKDWKKDDEKKRIIEIEKKQMIPKVLEDLRERWGRYGWANWYRSRD